MDNELYKQELQYYVDNELCPKCCGYVEYIGQHERDSSNDIHKCTNCGWQITEMCLWGIEKTPKE